MGELIYMFASLASRHQDGVTCQEGMRRLADTLHPHGVKITWIVSPESARIAAQPLTEWHTQYGDDIAVEVTFPTGSVEEKKQKMSAARDAIQAALPWANLTIAATQLPDSDSPNMLADVGFEGLWGFCWEQIEVDGITDRGCPWGFFYMDSEQRLRPSKQNNRGVIGMEWTARDLLKGFHSQNPCIYSTDPNDVARGGLCSWEDIDYWKGLADNYIRNTRYNDHVFFLQHQEAHETECSPYWQCYTEEDIRESLIMMDEFVRHIKDSARMMTLQEAASLYRDRYEQTPSSYMLWNDIPTARPNPEYAWSMAVGPWPKTFLFYDCEAQMMFVEGKVEPVCIRNYRKGWKADEYFAEPFIPRSRLVRDIRYHWDRDIEITVTSPRDMPFGFALWGDFSKYQVYEASGVLESKILSPELMFLRCNLKEGVNTFSVNLQGK